MSLCVLKQNHSTDMVQRALFTRLSKICCISIFGSWIWIALFVHQCEYYWLGPCSSTSAPPTPWVPHPFESNSQKKVHEFSHLKKCTTIEHNFLLKSAYHEMASKLKNMQRHTLEILGKRPDATTIPHCTKNKKSTKLRN